MEPIRTAEELEMQAERAVSIERLAALNTSAAAKKRAGEIRLADLFDDFQQKQAAAVVAQKIYEDARRENLGHGKELEAIERERSFLRRTAPASISESERWLAAIDFETRRDHKSTIGATKSALVPQSDTRSRALRRQAILAAYRRLEEIKFESIPPARLAEEIENLKKSVLSVEIVVDTVRTESRSFVTRMIESYERYKTRKPVPPIDESPSESW